MLISIVCAILMTLYFLVAVFFIYTIYAFITGAPFVPTSKKDVKAMLEIAELKSDDILMDLGSGDGRILKLAKDRVKKCIGIEINPLLYWWSKIKLARFKNVEIIRQDLWKTDLSGVDVLTLFFIYPKMEKLKQKIFKEMKPDARVVSYGFKFADWNFERNSGKIYLYKIPNI